MRLTSGRLPLIKGDVTESCVQTSIYVNAIKGLLMLEISAFPIYRSGGGAWGIFVVWVFFFFSGVIVRKIPVDTRLSACLWLRGKGGKLNHLPSWRTNPKQGLLGSDCTFGRMEKSCGTLS